MENWKDVPGYPGYQVSDAGRVRSFWILGHHRSIIGSEPQRIMKQCVMPSGHLFLNLWRDGKNYPKQVHALVLTAFVGPCPEGMECLRADDVPTNNHLANLRWGTRSENTKDAIRNGKWKLGENRTQAKLTNADVREIRKRLEAGEFQQAIADDYSVSRRLIGGIKTGKRWAHVAQEA